MSRQRRVEERYLWWNLAGEVIKGEVKEFKDSCNLRKEKLEIKVGSSFHIRVSYNFVCGVL